LAFFGETRRSVLGGILPRRKTARNAAAARANGVKGGRPRTDRAQGDFDALGPPPEDPLALERWTQRVHALDLWRWLTGRGDKVLSGQIRASTRAIVATTPHARLYEAEQILTDRADKRKSLTPDVEMHTDADADGEPTVYGSPPGR
jgi:hypothetical protein